MKKVCVLILDPDESVDDSVIHDADAVVEVRDGGRKLVFLKNRFACSGTWTVDDV
jgi:hypothetical protein